MASTCQGIEFVIDGKKSELVKKNLVKVEKLFSVNIVLKDHFRLKQQYDGVKQWIHITGPVNDCNNAKNYIIALTSPEFYQSLKRMKNHPLLTPNQLDLIEQRAQTVLAFEDGSDDLKIYGTEFSVAVAQSLIDHIIKETQLCHMNDSDSDEVDTVARDRNNSALSTLQKHQNPPFLSDSKTSYTTYASPSVLSPVTLGGQETCDGGLSDRQLTFRDTIPFTNGHFLQPKSYERGKADQNHAINQADSLWQFALDLHYCPEDIERSLSQYDMNNIVKPSDFLKTLDEIKSSRHCGLKQASGATAQAQITMATKGTHIHVPISNVANTGNNVTNTGNNIDLNDSVIFVGEEAPAVSVLDTVIISDDEADIEIDSTVACTSARGATGGGLLKSPKRGNSKPSYPSQRDIRRPTVNTLQTSDSTESEENTWPKQDYRKDLRYIVIDGSNVAMAHGDNKCFSVRGIVIAVKYFKDRGHDRITVFVPESRRYGDPSKGWYNSDPIRGKQLLEKLNQDGIVKFTPARRLDGGRIIASYDDRYILNLAEQEDGIIVSNDQFRDLCDERATYKRIVHSNLLQYVFVGDAFMPPDDPLGRNGPKLDVFLKNPSYNKPNVSFMPFKEVNRVDKPWQKPIITASANPNDTRRSREETQRLYEQLIQVFPNKDQSLRVYQVLENHCTETDLVKLTNYVMNALFSKDH
uniref:Uncharacterized protein n=1 Tax=Biomphalaria glabrata TaxID=6526 RepID=A0A2C9LAL8_BIOGL